MPTFKEKEQRCQCLFDAGRPYWHLYTAGKETPLIFPHPEDFAFAMNVIAQTAVERTGIRIIAFEIMGNHLHILAAGRSEELLEAFSFLRKRIARGLKGTHPEGLPRKFAPSLKEVTSLEAMRNTIVYINRNGFVADSDYTPYSYPWGTGGLFFGQEMDSHLSFNDISSLECRALFRGRVPKIPGDWPMSGSGYILPSAYCHADFGKAMFRDAHHYFSLLSKSVEALSELAVELDEEEFLTDPELFTRLGAILGTDYGVHSIKDLSAPQKYDLARRVRREFQSSNGQIRRVLALSRYEVDSLFPLTARG